MRLTRSRIVHAISAMAALGLFVLAVWLLHHQLRAYRYQDIREALEGIPLRQIVPAFLLTIGSYLILTFYDVLALRYIQRPLDYGRTAMASFIAYVFSHNVGLGVIGGTAARFRMYSTWGYSAVDVARIVTFTGATFWIGLMSVGGAAFVLRPPAVPESVHIPQSTLPVVGVVLLLLLAAYLVWCATWRAPIRIGGWEFAAPQLHLAVLQAGLAAVDWVIAATVLYVLLPSGAPPFPEFIGIFTLGQVIGFASHVPGGLGVFESIIVASMDDGVSVPSVVGSLIIYRGIYYLFPFIVGTALLGGHELLRRRERMRRAAQAVETWAPRIVPHAMALTSVLGGTVLLVSGTLPERPRHLSWVNHVIPLPVMELSHFVGSLAGMGLLVLGRGLQRRLDAAYRLTVLLLTLGILLTVLKAFDLAEAITLTVMLILLLPCRSYFYRKATLFSERFTPGWIVLVAMVLLGSAWLGRFAYKHVEYSNELWWRFSIGPSGNASRAWRAMVGAAGIAVLFGLTRLLRAGGPEPHEPSAEELEHARAVVKASPRSSAHLALLGDKSLLFNASRNTFIMYAVENRSWVAMGDPVGPPEEAAELAWQFRGMCDVHDGWTVFYGAGREYLDLYLDLGLTLLKIGEEARVELPTFSLDGGARKSLRQAYRRIEHGGCRLEVVPAEAVPAMLPELRVISDAWLAQKNVREKGFSLGFFDEAYLVSGPVAIVRHEAKIAAFANVWTAADKNELSVDLMRYRSDAPPGVMEYLFAALMFWGRDQGYRWFNLGMAPLAGLETRALAPLWTRVGSLLFEHGEHFYNFQGVRQYKDKFDPVWEPRYLASPGGLVLPRILTHLASLISGGLRGVVMK